MGVEGQKVVLFGGGAEDQRFADTWEWDGEDWEEATPSESPPARSGHALAHDPSGGGVLLFSGRAPPEQEGDLGDDLDDVWRWDGERWEKLAPSNAPPPGAGHALTAITRR